MNDVNISAVIKNMTIKTRKDGRVEGRITINNSRISFYGKTKAEVRQKAKEYLQKVSNGYKEPKKITLNEYIEYWLLTYKWNKIEPSSYTRLYRVYECQIKDSIGKKMIGSITTEEIQKFIDIHADPKDENVKALALSGLKRIIHLLRPCMSQAVKEGIISHNPCNDVILPVESCIKTKARKQVTMNDAELSQFRTAALARYKTTNEYCSRDALVLLVILNLGLRVGEMLALEWTDIQFDIGVVYINKTVQSGIKNFEESGNRQYTVTKSSTKTSSGERVLRLNTNVISYLRELQEYDIRNNINSKFVCCTNVGTQGNARNLQRSLDRVVRKTNIQKNITLHTLRHTFGSTLLRKGNGNIGIEVVSELLGHANKNITYLKYIHVLKEQRALAMENTLIC